MSDDKATLFNQDPVKNGRYFNWHLNSIFYAGKNVSLHNGTGYNDIEKFKGTYNVFMYAIWDQILILMYKMFTGSF